MRIKRKCRWTRNRKQPKELATKEPSLQRSTANGTSPWKALRTTNAIERINGEFRRRTKTQASLPNEDAVVLLMYGLLCSGQIRLRRMVGWKDLPPTTRSVVMAEAA